MCLQCAGCIGNFVIVPSHQSEQTRQGGEGQDSWGWARKSAPLRSVLLEPTLIPTLVFAQPMRVCRRSPPQVRLLGLPRFSADVLESRSCSGSLPARPTRTCSPRTLTHVWPPPFSMAGSFSLPQSLSWAPNREDSLPKKEQTQFGFSLRP